MVDFTFDAELIVPGDPGGSVADELRIDVGWLSHPTVEGVLFNAVGARITRCVGVDDARSVNGDHAIVRIAKEALRYLNFVGIDAFQNPLNEQEHIVSQNGGEGLVGPVDPVGLACFSGNIAPCDGGRTRAVGVGSEFSRKEDGLVGRAVVLNHGVGQGVVANESNVFVIITVLGVVGQKVGDGVVAVALCVWRNVNRVGAVGRIEDSDGCLLSEEVGAQFTGDLVVRSPDSDLQRIGPGGGQDVVDLVVVKPIQGRLTARSVKNRRDDEGRVNRASDFFHRLVCL